MSFTDKIKNCQLCPELKGRIHSVIGEGPVPCSIVLIGEAPGKKEDETGLPFQGAAGRVLRVNLFRAKITSDIYHILNVIKCRPPENREPLIGELYNCRPYLIHQLNALNPKIIIAMGRFSQAFILEENPSDVKVLKNVGRLIDFPLKHKNIKFKAKSLLTFHPAFVLRNQANHIEQAFLEHLKTAKKLLEAL